MAVVEGNKMRRDAFCRRLFSNSFLFAGSLAMLLVCQLQLCAQPPKYAQELFASLKEPPAKGQGFDLAGPDAKDHAKFEASGLRITLPAGFAKVRPALGVASNCVVRGNFEITVSYDVLLDPEQADTAEFGTRLALIVGMESPNQSTIKFSRSVRARTGVEYLAFSAQWNAAEGKHDKRYLPLVTKTKAGRMRLVRTDGVISFLAAERDKDFENLRSYAFTTDDMNTVRVVANTDGPKASFDVRLSDFRIRFGTPAEQAADGRAPEPAVRADVGDQKQAGGHGWLTALVLIGVMFALILGASVGLVVYLLKGGPAKNAPVKN